MISAFSPSLASALITQIGGLAQRSELDALCKPLRAFIFGQPGAKGYLEAALLNVQTAEGSNVSEQDKRMFLQKVVGLRGGRQTNVVVREFWASCKGTVSSFE